MAHNETKPSIHLSLGDFAREAILREADRGCVAVDRLVQEGVRHWLVERSSGRPSMRMPPFQSGGGAAVDLSLELEPEEWDELEAAARAEGEDMDRLLCHIVAVLLADLDSGRLVMRPARSDPAEDE